MTDSNDPLATRTFVWDRNQILKLPSLVAASRDEWKQRKYDALGLGDLLAPKVEETCWWDLVDQYRGEYRGFVLFETKIGRVILRVNDEKPGLLVQTTGLWKPEMFPLLQGGLWNLIPSDPDSPPAFYLKSYMYGALYYNIIHAHRELMGGLIPTAYAVRPWARSILPVAYWSLAGAMRQTIDLLREQGEYDDLLSNPDAPEVKKWDRDRNRLLDQILVDKGFLSEIPENRVWWCVG